MCLDANGYERYSDTKKLVHREVCRQAHGEFLPSWHVHHVNGRKLDNRPENLVALPPGLHQALHESFPMRKLPCREECVQFLNEWIKSRTACLATMFRRSKKRIKKLRRLDGRRISKANRKRARKIILAGGAVPDWFKSSPDSERLIAIWQSEAERRRTRREKKERRSVKASRRCASVAKGVSRQEARRLRPPGKTIMVRKKKEE